VELEEPGIEGLYDQILDSAVALMRADFASMQMLYPERGSGGQLRLLGARGFTPEAVRTWEWVSADAPTSCGLALRTEAVRS